MTSGHSSAVDRRRVLAAVCLAALMLPLSFTGGAIATPAIVRELGGGALARHWITNAFMLSFGSLLMAAGALADAWGRRRVFAGGILGFTVMSLLTVWAPDLLWLDLLRALQGVAAAAALAGGSAALAQAWDGPGRARAFSLLGTSFGLGLAMGPVLAGLLIRWIGWRSVFMTSACIGALSLLLGVPGMRESRDPGAQGLDWLGAGSFSGALGLLTWGVLQLPVGGWSNPEAWGLIAGAGLSLRVFVHVERRSRRPMLDLTLFRHRRFVGVQMLPVATCFCYVVLQVLLPLRLIGIEGCDEVQAGLVMVVLSLPMLVMPSVAARLLRTSSPAELAAGGLLLAAVGLVWLGCTSGPDSPVGFYAALLVIGMGSGLPWGLMDGLAVSAVPTERAGMAAGIFSTIRVAVEGVGIAIVAALLSLFIQVDLPAATPGLRATAARHLSQGELVAAAQVLHASREALASSYREGFQLLTMVLATITAAAAMLVLWLLREPARCHPRRRARHRWCGLRTSVMQPKAWVKRWRLPRLRACRHQPDDPHA